ncbi:hypothetical protein X975_14985, partial [Stegodyphus mimosarum]
MNFTNTQKGKCVLIYLGFDYLHFRVTNGIITCRCQQSRSIKCKSMMKTQGEEIIQETTSHCHDSLHTEDKGQYCKK